MSHHEHSDGMKKTYLPHSLLLLLVVSLLGCALDATVETGPPEGWQAEDMRWWRTDIDTTGAFRDLETLASMRVADAELQYVTTPNLARQRTTQQRWFKRAVKQSLIRLYRNQPEIVDSLFELHVTPMLEKVKLSASPRAEVERFKRKSYQFLYKNHFQVPQTRLQIGRDIEMPYPDALRKRQVVGTVRIQAYINAEGEPLTLQLLQSVDPELDGIAMRAMTQMRWRPAYTMGKGRWSAIPAWARLGVKFGGGA